MRVGSVGHLLLPRVPAVAVGLRALLLGVALLLVALGQEGLLRLARVAGLLAVLLLLVALLLVALLLPVRLLLVALRGLLLRLGVLLSVALLRILLLPVARAGGPCGIGRPQASYCC
ncbi:hypothetical protein GA0115246_100554 [Streptomyces sp. SolWspMP-sol7th]|nr:hypothetical protein GA0115246_100554 [Streptomyces sp. SolWspMP-sol7th]